MEMNPQHPKTREMHNLWHSIVGVLMHKLGQDRIEITMYDATSFHEKYGTGGACIVVKTEGDKEVLRLVTMEEGKRIAAESAGRN